MKDCETEVLNLENELKEKATRIDDLTKSLHAKDEELQKLEVTFSHENLAIRDAGQKEVQRLNSYIEQRERASKDAELCANQLKAKCQKLESKLALIEQKTAQESLTSGSYSDDHANPGMLEVACKAVDKAIDDLVRVLYNISYLKTLPLDSVELEPILHLISPAHPTDFSRPIQVKYVWGHWILHQIFRDFENVFFDSDQWNRTSPLHSKKHALECFQSFQQKKSASSLEFLNSCGTFQSFFSWKYKCVFPTWLVDSSILPSGIVVNEYGHFVEGEIFYRFLDVAKAVWLLHELAFSFDPPASILRMARGEPYDKQFHDSVVHVDVEDGDAPSAKVAFMIRPAFRIRQSIVRSRVLLSTKLPQ